MFLFFFAHVNQILIIEWESSQDLRFPNIRQGFQGYNLIKGDPLTHRRDPGYTSSIFDARNERKLTVQFKNVPIHSLENCHANVRGDTLENVEEFMSSTISTDGSGRDFKLGAELEVEATGELTGALATELKGSADGSVSGSVDGSVDGSVGASGEISVDTSVKGSVEGCVEGSHEHNLGYSGVFGRRRRAFPALPALGALTNLLPIPTGDFGVTHQISGSASGSASIEGSVDGSIGVNIGTTGSIGGSLDGSLGGIGK